MLWEIVFICGYASMFPSNFKSEFLDSNDESVERCTICYHRAAALGFDVCERCMELHDVDFL